ncbi:hypothetical protein, partial [Paenibacillus cookii]|uniref:hypothetical protein n=1 Tax=Paenibacillus cookii TaxID=157839 RepID=UPI001BB44A88
FGLDFADGCGRLHLKGAPFFVGDVLDKHHSTKELEPFSCFSDDVTFEIQDYLFIYMTTQKGWMHFLRYRLEYYWHQLH